MSETQSTLFNRRAGGLLIAGALLLLATVFVVCSPSFLPLPTETFILKMDTRLQLLRSEL